jgi:hypothetical protein
MDLFEEIVRMRRAGQRGALATIVHTNGLSVTMAPLQAQLEVAVSKQKCGPRQKTLSETSSRAK